MRLSLSIPRHVVISAVLALALASCAGGDGTEEAGVEPDGAETADGSEDESAESEDDLAAQFYGQSSLTIQVGFGEGGGFDTAARLLARHLGRHIPGSPDVAVVNNPGAGSIANANEMFASSPRDGSVIGINHRELLNADLQGQEGLEFELQEFGWIGGIGRSSYAIVVRADMVETLDQALETPLIFGASGPGTSTHGAPLLMNELLGTNYEIITGYDGVGDIAIALERGEVDAVAVGVDSLLTQRTHWLEDGIANALLIVGRDEEDRLPGVPTFYDLVETEEHRAVLDLFTAPGELGYAFSTPPELPDHILQALQQAMTDTINDPEFQADADELGLDYRGSRSGAELEEILAEVYATSQQEIDLFNSYMQAD